MNRYVLSLVFGTLLLSAGASGQLVDQFAPPRANCCLPAAAKGLADQLQDWNQLGRYHADDERLKAQPPEPRRVVFLGDSITDGWKLAQYFPGKPYVNRGISGQTTPQMLVRMYPDVIDLSRLRSSFWPGTNDIARNTGPETLTMIEENFQAITELAQAHGIKVILCSVTPVSDYTAHKQTIQRRPADILKLNAWLREYAARAQRRNCGLLCRHGGRQGHADARATRMTACIPMQGLCAARAGGRSSDRKGAALIRPTSPLTERPPFRSYRSRRYCLPHPDT